MADDLAFTFDTSFFDKGISKVMKGFSSMETKASTVAKGVSKGLTAVAGKLGIIYAGFKTIKSALLGMPEVGQAFGIAKDVFMKNLLYPLRKEIFPLLQKMLDWVRDSRGTFVKWGQNLANIFRAVVEGVKNIMNFVRQMSDRVAGFAEKIFGDRIKNINDVFNIVSFKLSTVIQFISILAEKAGGIFGNIAEAFLMGNEEGNSFLTVVGTLVGYFADIALSVAGFVGDFVEGFLPYLNQAWTPIQRIVDAFIGIKNAIFDATSKFIDWESIFTKLGEIVGTGILKTFEFIATVLEKIEETINLIGGIGFVETFKEKGGNLLESAGNFAKGILGIDDGIIRPDGTVVKTNPQDTLVAMKNVDSSLAGLIGNTTNNQTRVEKTISVPIDFSGMIIQVQNGGVEEGQEFAMGLIEQMRNEFNRDFERFGLG